MQGSTRTSTSVLALLYAVSAATCFAAAAWPLAEGSPTGLCWALGSLGTVVAVLLRLARDRCAPAVHHAGLALLWLLVALLAARSVTPAGVVGLGPVLVVLALHAAHFLPPAARRAHVAGALLAASAGAALSPASGFLLLWAVDVVAVVGVAEVHGHLVGRLRAAASTDPLTGVANRRAWAERSEQLLRRARATGRPLTVAVLDLDGFKAVNDTAGHAAGDALLRDVADAWSGGLRARDVLARLGGDEFVLALPDTGPDEARALLDRLARTRATAWSSGTATSSGGDALDDLLSRADAALYAAKRARVPDLSG